jgi:hypothetical protein
MTFHFAADARQRWSSVWLGPSAIGHLPSSRPLDLNPWTVCCRESALVSSYDDHAVDRYVQKLALLLITITVGPGTVCSQVPAIP